MNSGMTVLRLMVHRFRLAYLIFSIFLVMMMGVAHLPESWIPEWLAGILCLPFGFGLLMTVFGFVNIEADIASTASAYSPWLLRLPVKTKELAFWPIFAAAVWAFGSWEIFTIGFLWQRGLHPPLIWPGMMFAALALSMQAVLWRPVKRGNVRLVFSLVLSTVIILFGYIAAQLGWFSENISAVYGAVALVSAAGAWWSLYLARTSPSSGMRASSVVANVVKVNPLARPFRSARAAQFWLEWRRQGRLLPLLTGLGLFAISVPLFFFPERQIVGYTDQGQSISMSIWMISALPFIPWIPLLFATVIGMGARPSDIRGADGNYHLYYATRPLVSQEMVRAKMMAIALGVAITAIITTTVIMLWLCLPAMLHNGTIVPYYTVAFFKSFEREQWTAVFLIGLAAIAWTWRNQTVGAFVDYMPSHKFAMAYPVVVTTFGALAFVLMTTYNGELQKKDLASGWITVFALALIFKVGAAIYMASKQLRLRPNSRQDVLTTVAWWLGTGMVAAFSVGLIVNWIPQTVVPAYMVHPAPELAALLLVPLVRPLGARLALELGRHR